MCPLLRPPRSLSSATGWDATAGEQVAALLVAEDRLQRSRRRGGERRLLERLGKTGKDWERLGQMDDKPITRSGDIQANLGSSAAEPWED